MDYQELAKNTVSKLREMVKEQLPDVKGVAGLRKEELVNLLAEKWGIAGPRKVAVGAGKAELKAEIRKLKVSRKAAVDARDKEKMKATREELHRLRRQLRRTVKIKT